MVTNGVVITFTKKPKIEFGIRFLFNEIKARDRERVRCRLKSKVTNGHGDTPINKNNQAAATKKLYYRISFNLTNIPINIYRFAFVKVNRFHRAPRKPSRETFLPRISPSPPLPQSYPTTKVEKTLFLQVENLSPDRFNTVNDDQFSLPRKM